MINNFNTFNNRYLCSPLLATTPFPTALISQGNVGRVGLSGPNVELITFNSGDTFIENLVTYAIGLGVAQIIMVGITSIELSQLG